MDVLDRGKVDYQAVVAYSQAAGVMAAAPNRDSQIMFPPEVDCRYHVGNIDALRNQARFAIDHRVVNLAILVVAWIRGLNQLTPELSSEFNHILHLHWFLHPGYVPSVPDSCTQESLPCAETDAASSTRERTEKPHTSGRPGLAGLSPKLLARNFRVPIHKRAVRIVLPRPDMQRVKGRKPEAIRTFPIMKKLAHELRRTLVFLVPGIGKQKKIRADQFQSAIWCRLVNHDLGMGGIEFAAAHQVPINVVKAHGS